VPPATRAEFLVLNLAAQSQAGVADDGLGRGNEALHLASALAAEAAGASLAGHDRQPSRRRCWAATKLARALDAPIANEHTRPGHEVVDLKTTTATERAPTRGPPQAPANGLLVDAELTQDARSEPVTDAHDPQ
jgi:hypothetical protein